MQATSSTAPSAGKRSAEGDRNNPPSKRRRPNVREASRQDFPKLMPELWSHVLSFADEESLARFAQVSRWLNVVANTVVLRPLDAGDALAGVHIYRSRNDLDGVIGRCGLDEEPSFEMKRALRERVERLGNRYRHIACPIRPRLENQVIQGLTQGRRWQHVRLEIEGDMKVGRFLNKLESSLGNAAVGRSFALSFDCDCSEDEEYLLQPYLEENAMFSCVGFEGSECEAPSDLLPQVATTQTLRMLRLFEFDYADTLAALETGSDRLQDLLLEDVPQDVSLERLYAMLARKNQLRVLELRANEKFEEAAWQGPRVVELMRTGTEELTLWLFTFSSVHFAGCHEWMVQENSLRKLSFVDVRFTGRVPELERSIRKSKSLKTLEFGLNNSDPEGLVVQILRAVSHNTSLESIKLYIKRSYENEAALELLRKRRPELKIRGSFFHSDRAESEDSAATSETPSASEEEELGAVAKHHDMHD